MTAPAKASGKVILFGEHAVVHGIPAIAVGIDRGVEAWASPLDAGPTRLAIDDYPGDILADDTEHELARALRSLLEASGSAGARPLALRARAELPPGGGLGCSAALGVALARAVDPAAPVEDIEARAMAWERVFHGNPSGIDAAVSARGGCVFFEKGKTIESVRAKGGLLLCVGHTGMPSSTKTMVDAVSRLAERRPGIVAKTFEGIRSIVMNARLALEDGDLLAIGRFMDLNQMLLSGLFVSTQEIERMCATAREAGARGAKLTGAGGGGSVIALVDDAKAGDAVIAAWKSDGFDGGFLARVEDATPLATISLEVTP